MDTQKESGAIAAISIAVFGILPLLAIITCIVVGLFFGLVWGFVTFGAFLLLLFVWFMAAGIANIKKSRTTSNFEEDSKEVLDN